MPKMDTEQTLRGSEPAFSLTDTIRIRGARVHNLKNIDLDIPRNAFVVITGPSGSGKSSLARDTLCAESQRQYVESLSVYARQFLTQIQRPDVDLMEGLQPTIAIDQRAANPNPRSTVATATEIHDYLRLLMARLGEAHCYECGAGIQQQTPEEILESVYRLPEGTKAMIMAPLVRGRKGKHLDVAQSIRKAGFVRVRVDGTIYDIENFPDLAPRKAHNIEAVIDRVVIRRGIESRIVESIDLALQHGDQTVILCYPSDLSEESKPVATPGGRPKSNTKPGAENVPWQDQIFSARYACPHCRISYEEIEPRTFSFNSPYGACPDCDGLGMRVAFDPELLIPDMQLSLAEGAVVAWRGLGVASLKKIQAELEPFFTSHRFDWQAPVASMKRATYDLFLRGDGKRFIGILNILEKELATTSSEPRQRKLAAFRDEILCPACKGTRLRPEAQSVLFGGKAIHEIGALTISEAVQFLETVHVDPQHEPIAKPILRAIESRLRFLEKVGVTYLTLDRSADSLSGGELQRVRLATSIGSGLVGVCYILDEPSIGLHPRDNQCLIDALRELQQQRNSVLVVEHDEAMMLASDFLIDMGPGAGDNGGTIVATGTPENIRDQCDSLTGQYLAHRLEIPIPEKRRSVTKSHSLELLEAATNNLKSVDVRFPLSTLICVTGVSGSGKSSLINETLARAVTRRLGGGGPKPGPHRGLRGIGEIKKLIMIDQSPIGRTPRSNPATYTGIFDEIRKVFAGTKTARARGFGAGRFSFNVKGGRCETCQGQGERKIDMTFLPDLHVTCSDCQGSRFNRQTLEIQYRNLSIADVLNLQIEAAVDFFENFPPIQRTLQYLKQVGLGYLTLGQPSTTLSGGEAQRIKLATELARTGGDHTFYILDEPTTGLHFDDVRRLLAVLDLLVEQGNTVLVIEHNLEVIKTADWIIDLGPEGGAAGGEVVATGTPEEIARMPNNHTGQFLRTLLPDY